MVTQEVEPRVVTTSCAAAVGWGRLIGGEQMGTVWRGHAERDIGDRSSTALPDATQSAPRDLDPRGANWARDLEAWDGNALDEAMVTGLPKSTVHLRHAVSLGEASLDAAAG